MGPLSGMPDAVQDSRIETSILNGGKEFQHVKFSLGSSVMRRRLRSEETWSPRRLLGRGSFGQVWLQECVAGSPRRELRAVKEIMKHQMKTSYLFRELETIAKFSQDKYAHCFVRSSGWFEDDSSWFIAMEYMPYGDLDQAVKSPLQEPEARQIIFQTVEGVSFMHGSGFAHRDLKPSNIMVFRPGPSWWIKITDFGISKRTNDMVTGTLEIGTVAFMAPELRGMCGPEEAETAGGYREYPNAVDIWAIGEITHRLLTQEPLFATGRQLSHYVFLGASFPSEKLQNFGSSRDAIDFVIRCMDAGPSRRLTALDALNHSWLANHEFITEPEHFEPPQNRTHTYQENSEPSQSSAWSDEPSARWSDALPSQQSFLAKENRSVYSTASTEPSAKWPSTIGPQRTVLATESSYGTSVSNEPSARWSAALPSQQHYPTQQSIDPYETRTVIPVAGPEGRLPSYQKSPSPPPSFASPSGDNILRDQELFPWTAPGGEGKDTQRPLSPPPTMTEVSVAPKPTPSMSRSFEPRLSQDSSNTNVRTETYSNAGSDLVPCPVQECPHHKQGFGSEGRMKRHVITQHPDYNKPRPESKPVRRASTGFICPVRECRRHTDGFGSQGHLRQHIAGVHGDLKARGTGFLCPVFSCPQNLEPLSSLALLNRHIEQAHPGEARDDVTTGWPCPIQDCDYKYQGFSTAWLLVEHFERAHGGEKGLGGTEFTCIIISCPYNKRGFSSLVDLNHHMERSHSSDELELSKTGFTCPIQGCDHRYRGYSSESRLLGHIDKVHGAPKEPGSSGFSCSVATCPYHTKPFSSIVGLNCHIERSHAHELELAVRGYPCPFPSCDFRYQGFSSQKRLERHIKTAHDDQEKSQADTDSTSHTCPVKSCRHSHQGFASESRLKRHIDKVHSSQSSTENQEGPQSKQNWKCPTLGCPYAYQGFQNSRELQRHRAIVHFVKD
ncbi:unnamed protein product [Clonostachys rosea f. rosea IK726]|uniref:Protein kinase domain-containing protein n=2 Tax=Bionectria ochroleuca TaxID=29856 RepID=A0A0B7K6S3_BIOOC|nr:unnamed protein product [Clonostachys rosea f. rosea IK726]